MKTKFKTLEIESPLKHILLVTLNRPEVRNAMNIDMMQDLLNLWTDITSNFEKYRCVILTGAGDKAFSAGADLKARKNMTIEVWQEQHQILQKAMRAMIDCPVPIIAAVNGAAFGGGLELTLASDFAYAVDTAIFGQSEVKIGLIPGAMGTQNLPRATGIRRAKELTFTGESFSAQRAFEWGIINRVCAHEDLMQEAFFTAERIAENAPLAIIQAKQALNASQNMDIHTGYSYEVEAYNQVLATADRVEGINAFNEKRKAQFLGQ